MSETLLHKVCVPKHGPGALMRKCAAEFLGVLMLSFVGVAGRPDAVIAALNLSMVILVIGQMSGGHANPMVTFLLLLRGQIDILTGITYWISQYLGGIIGAILAKLVIDSSSNEVGMHLLASEVSVSRGFIMEFYVALYFCFVVLAMTHTFSNEDGEWRTVQSFISATLIGLSMIVVIGVAGPISGGSVNPSRSLGPAIANQNFKNQWIYVVAPLSAAVAANLLFSFLFDTSFNVGNQLSKLISPCHNKSQNEVNEQDSKPETTYTNHHDNYNKTGV